MHFKARATIVALALLFEDAFFVLGRAHIETVKDFLYFCGKCEICIEISGPTLYDSSRQGFVLSIVFSENFKEDIIE